MLQLQFGNRLFELFISIEILTHFVYPLVCIMYTMVFLPMGSLINSDTFSQENTSPKQIIIHNILCNKGFPIHLITEKHEKIIQ
jgi:hypothetical protein